MQCLALFKRISSLIASFDFSHSSQTFIPLPPYKAYVLLLGLVHLSRIDAQDLYSSGYSMRGPFFSILGVREPFLLILCQCIEQYPLAFMSVLSHPSALQTLSMSLWYHIIKLFTNIKSNSSTRNSLRGVFCGIIKTP